MHIIAGNASTGLVRAICDGLGDDPTPALVGRFGDGEVRVKIEENVRGDDVFIVNSTHPPFENFAETIFLANAARNSSAKRVTLVIPYLGYNRQDRKPEPRVPVSAKIAIDMLKLSRADRALLVDLHSEPTASHFEPIIVDHLYASFGVVPYLKRIMNEPFVVAAPDVGASTRARKYAQYLGLPDIVVFNKLRVKAGEVDEDSIKIIGDVNGRDVLFIDDLIDSGGTLIADAKAAKKEGAKRIRAFTAHALFSKGTGVFTPDLFDEVIITDTIFHKPDVIANPGGAKITVQSIAPLLSKAIKRVHHDESLSPLILG